MKKKDRLISSIFISLIFTICVLFWYFSMEDEESTSPNKPKTLPRIPQVTQQSVQNIQADEQKKAIDAEIKHEERQKKGDTLAISDKKLAEYLPEKPLGFTKINKTVNNPYNMSGQKFANSEQEYTKGNVNLRINLIDYNAGVSPDVTASAFWTKELGSENDNERSTGFSLKNKMKGWEIFFKKKRKAEITVAISDRFTLIIKANQQTDCETLKNIANEMQPQLDILAKK